MSQDALFQGQSEVRPKLNPPIYRWQEDMPENNQPQLVPPQLIWLNTKNSIWMEIPRYEGVMWGGALFMIFFFSAIFVFIFIDSISMLVDDFDYITFAIMLFYYLMLGSVVFFIL